MSGSTGERVAVVTARARSLPPLTAVSTFALLGVPLGAQAAQIDLGGTTTGLTFTGTGGNSVIVSIAAGTGDGTLLNFLGPIVREITP